MTQGDRLAGGRMLHDVGERDLILLRRCQRRARTTKKIELVTRTESKAFNFCYAVVLFSTQPLPIPYR